MNGMALRHSFGRRTAGFTLVELLLALALSSVVGLLTAMMLAQLSAATRDQSDIRRAEIARQVAVARLGAFARSTSMALASDASHLVLWKGDVNGDGRPNLSELRRLTWDAGAQDVRTCESPANLDPALDQTYQLTDDFLAIAAAHAGSPAFPESVALQHVTAAQWQFDTPSAQTARLIRLQVTLNNASGTDVATIISALHAQGSVT